MEFSGRDDVIRALLAEHFSSIESALTALMKRGQAQGEISAGKSPLALARFILSTVQGLRVIARGSDDEGLAERFDDVVDVALKSL